MHLLFPVSPEKQKKIEERMLGLGVFEADLEEKFIKSGGRGGQNVNKVSTSVLLIHKVSGLEVKCSVYRTQGLNRYKARSILCDKIEENNRNLSKTKDPAIEKIRKRKTDKLKKSKKRKELLLELKAKESEEDEFFE